MPKVALGLTSNLAQELLKEFGPNVFEVHHKKHAVVELFRLFTNPIVLILIGAAFLSGILGNLTSCIIITVMVTMSVVLDFVTSYRSERAAEALKNRVKVMAQVYRDGKEQLLTLSQLVPGDVVHVSAGSLIPADGMVLDSNSLFISEAALTGESFPQHKEADGVVFLGSAVLSGEGLIQVTQTGARSQYAHIAKSLTAQVRPTEYEKELQAFSQLILRVTALLVIFVFGVNLFVHRPLLESLLFSLALAVGLTPEMLPLIVTLNLTRGSLSMVRHGVIVKQLSAVQNFGNMDILCTDKTGTLTEDKISLVKYVDALGNQSEEVLQLGYLSSVFSTGFENPLDRAIQSFRHLTTHGYTKLGEIPFDFKRKREVVLVSDDQQKVSRLIIKGAPEEIVTLCSHFGQHNDLIEAHRRDVTNLYTQLSQDGFRVLALASKIVDHQRQLDSQSLQKLEQALTFVGFLAFLDPAKKSVIATLHKMKQLGIQIKIISGDNQYVTQKIARDIELPIEGILTGEEMKRLSPVQLKERIEKTTLFCRVIPEQKMQIIQTLQDLCHVVGYLGDGINDAPSLRAADVGVSVNNAVDVAKDAADLILLRKNLHELVEGVVEGRKTFANTMKYLRMTLSSNFGNMFSMAGASVFLPFLPLKATQLLLNNMMYDTSQFAIPFDHVDEADILKPQTLSLSQLKKYMWQYGLLSSAFDFATFGLLLLLFHASEGTFQSGWFLESIFTQTLVVLVIRTRFTPIITSRPSWQLVVSIATMLSFALFCVLGPLSQWFAFGPVSLPLLLSIAMVVAAYLLSAEVLKRHLVKSEQR